MSARIRFDVEYPVLVEGKQSLQSSIVTAKTLNLSHSGLGLRIPLDSPLAAGQSVKVTFQFGSAYQSIREQLTLDAKIIWRKGDACGLEIRSLQSREHLQYAFLVDGCELLQNYQPLYRAQKQAA